MRGTSHADRQQVLKAQLAQQQQLQMQIEQMQRRMQQQMEAMALGGGAPALLAEQVAALGAAPAVGSGAYDLYDPPRGAPPAAAGPSRARENGIRKIFVGGLHYDTGEEQLSSYFSTFGEIEEVQVMYNRETNKSRGFGFVTFRAAESADQVLMDRMHVIDRKSVEVKLAVPKSEVGGGRRLAPRPVLSPSRDMRAPYGVGAMRDPSAGAPRWGGQPQQRQPERGAWGAGAQSAMRTQPLVGAPRAPAPQGSWGAYREADDHAREHRGPVVDMGGAWEEEAKPVAAPAAGFNTNTPAPGAISAAPAWPTSAQAPAPSQPSTWGGASTSFMSFFPTTGAADDDKLGGGLYGDLAPQRDPAPAVDVTAAAVPPPVPAKAAAPTAGPASTDDDAHNSETFPGAS